MYQFTATGPLHLPYCLWQEPLSVVTWLQYAEVGGGAAGLDASASHAE